MPGLLRELGLLAESGGQRENQLTRTFAAVFNNSVAIRTAVVPFLLARFQLKSRTPPAEWHCRYEKRNRLGNGRLDLVISPKGRDHLTRSREVIILENKVDAKLRQDQLLKYGPHESHLGVITSRHPEVSAAWLREKRIRAIRWHELHGVLIKSNASGRRDFVTTEFTIYLEELGMASRGLTRGDLIGIQGTFALLAGPTGGTKVHQLRFERAAVAKAFVEDVANAFRDAAPGGILRMWGPGYSKDDYQDDEGAVHEFGFWIRSRTNRRPFPTVGYSLAFPQNKKQEPYAWAGVSLASDEEFKSLRVWAGPKLFDRQGNLREEEHIRQATSVLRRLVRQL
jgi:hypothetical protein